MGVVKQTAKQHGSPALYFFASEKFQWLFMVG